jgi:hypothetical protein
MASILIIVFLTAFFLYLYWLQTKERYLALCLSFLPLIGFINRSAMYYFDDYSEKISLLNILLLAPVFIMLFKNFTIAMRSKIYIGFIILLLVLLCSFINPMIVNFKAKLFDLSTYGIAFGIMLFSLRPQFRIDYFFIQFIQYFLSISIFISLYGILQYFLGPNSIDSNWMYYVRKEFTILGHPKPLLIKPFSVTASPGHFAITCCIAIILASNYLKYLPHNFFQRIITTCVIFFSFIGLLVSGVRSILAFTVFFLIANEISKLFVNNFNTWRYLKYFIALSFGVILFFKLGPDLNFSSINKRLESFNKVLSGDDVSLNARIHTANLVINEIQKNPLGYGFGKSGKFSGNEFEIIDSGYLDWALESGIIGLILLVLSFIYAFINLKTNFHPKSALEACLKNSSLWFCGLVAYSLFFGNSLQVSITWIALAIIGMALTKYRYSTKKPLLS